MRFLSILVLFCFISCSKSDSTVYTIHDYVYDQNESDPTESPTDPHSLVGIIQKYRNDHGLVMSQLNNHMSYTCGTHNDYMISKGVASQDYFTDAEKNLKNTLHVTRVGRIVAMNFSTNTSFLNAVVAKPACKAILEGDFALLGVSIKNDQGKKFYTVLFAK
jgi:hypothetical protein